MGRVLNMFGMGRAMAAVALWDVCLICLVWAALWPAAALWGVCLICLAWTALWLRPPYAACAQYVWHGPPYGCGRPMGHVLNMVGMGHPMAVAALWGACLICLACAALWLRPPYGACA